MRAAWSLRIQQSRLKSHKVRAESLDYLGRDGDRLKGGARHASEHDMAAGYQIRLALLVYFEPKRQRLVPESANIGRDLNRVVKHQRFVKFEVYLHTRQPDIEAIKHFGIRQAYCAKEFGLRNLKESEKLTVINNPSAV